MATLSKVDTAKTLGVSRAHLYTLIKQGQISVEPDGTIDTTELLKRGFSLSPVDTEDMSADVLGAQMKTLSADVLSDVHRLQDRVHALEERLADTKQALHDAKAEKARLLAIIEGQQRLLEAAKPPPVWPRLKAWVHGRRKAQEGSFS